jgi:hypothetical protein
VAALVGWALPRPFLYLQYFFPQKSQKSDWPALPRPPHYGAVKTTVTTAIIIIIIIIIT